MRLRTTDKFAELVLYISKVCATDPKFGVTKLNKILFFSDWLSYRRRLQPITDATYQKLAHGPAPRAIVPVQKALIREQRLAIQEIPYYGRVQKRPVALREPDLNVLSADDIAIVETVIKALWNENAQSVSDLSHTFVGWDLAEINEDIPIEVSLIEHNPEVMPADLQHAKTLAARAEKALAA